VGCLNCLRSLPSSSLPRAGTAAGDNDALQNIPRGNRCHSVLRTAGKAAGSADRQRTSGSYAFVPLLCGRLIRHLGF